MNPLLKNLLYRYMAPAVEEGADTGGTDTATADRGDEVDPSLTADNLEAVVRTNEGEDPAPNAEGETAPAGAVEPADDTQHDDSRPGGIPKVRFDQVNNQRKQLAAENERLQRELEAARAPKAPAAPAPAAAPAAGSPAAAEKFDADAKEEAYIQALLEGETAKASKIRREINAHLIAQASDHAEAKVTSREAAKQLEAEVATTIKAHPWLDTAEGADALELIVAARDAGVARGVPAYKALRDAVAKIAPKFAPASAQPPAGELPVDPNAADTRTANALKRGAADSEAQPPVVQAGVGNRATAGRVNVAQMDETQFANLSEAEKSRLRGD